MNLLGCKGEYRKISRDRKEEPVTSSVTRWVEAFQCSDPRCDCRRTGTNKHTLHCPAPAHEHPSLALSW